MNEAREFISENRPVLLLEAKLSEKLRLRAADAMFSRQQVVPNLGVVNDSLVGTRYSHVAILRL